MAAIALWAASGVCAVIAVLVYKNSGALGSLIITVFAAGWLVALVLFLRTKSHD
jgi:hypothetical protein